ncbi:MAG: HD domain-containing protein [Galactobacter sp.]|uniref:HD domain-containing protein n=1 Tax=Galactobacter sp. TaxID=2676125 RepID=UPI0025C25EA0|nr:HD domain-containing protein [Galactobacter sp.]
MNIELTHPLADAADTVAEWAHAGQLDKTGHDYIEHPRRVAQRVAARLGGDHPAVIVALLHDVVEDADVSEADLQERFGSDITAAVLAISRTPGEDPDAYYARVAANPLALQVKQSDLDDNTDPDRVAQLDQATRDRLAAKYAHARQVLGL